jgi:hypothetical protein
MHRRRFLTTSALTMIGSGWLSSIATGLAAGPTRAERWPWVSRDVLQWRYLAGRVTLAEQDTGFIISIVRRLNSNFTFSYQLLVERQPLPSGAFVHQTYDGTISYDGATLTYTFRDGSNTVLATWRLDTVADVYRLDVATPELTLSALTLQPAADLLVEAGTGDIPVGSFRTVPFRSDYHADWVTVIQAGAPIGVARLDMQGIYPPVIQQPGSDPDDYDHHWFAVDALQGTQPVRLSCWRIEQPTGPIWCVTVQQPGAPPISATHEQPAVQPLTVTPLTWQPQPSPSTQLTGRSWHLRCGIAAPGDLLDLIIEEVPAGQFIAARQGALSTQTPLLEAIGLGARGTIRHRPLSQVRLVVAESSAEFPADSPPLPAPNVVTQALYLPSLVR